VYAFLAEHRRELFPDEMFADLFPSRLGRPSVPADVVASVLLLQALEGRTDREAVEALTFDLRWKAACGWPIDRPGFHATVLTYWRRRLAGSGRPNRIFDVVREVLRATGALTGKTRRALDSTVLDDAVATQDTVTQLIAAIRRVRREVPGAVEVIAAHCTAHDYDDPGKPAIAWNDAEARAAVVDALVTDAHRLLGHLPEQELGPRAAEALALLALVAGQDVEPAEGSDGTEGRWQIARRVAEDRVISTVDPDARHAHKTVHHRRDGFTAHLEVEPDTGLIGECALTKASGADNSDATVGVALLADDPTVTGAVEVLGDSAYGTGDASPGWPPPGTRRWSNPGRCARPCPAGSPSTTSPSTRRPAPSPARTGSPARSAGVDTSPSARPAAAARCGNAAPPPPTDAPCACTGTTRSSGRTGPAPRTQTSRPPTGGTGRWSNAASPGSPVVTGGCPTAAWPTTTPGCTSGSPRSTSAGCSPWA
jgi:hypothetical protein